MTSSTMRTVALSGPSPPLSLSLESGMMRVVNQNTILSVNVSKLA